MKANSQAMKRWSKISLVLLHEGQAPSILISNFLSLPLVGGSPGQTFKQTGVIWVSNLIPKYYWDI